MKNQQDKAFECLLKEELKKESEAKQSLCPDVNQMAAYLEKRHLPPQNKAFESHLAECARCREQLAILLRMEENLGKPSVDSATETGINWVSNSWSWLRHLGLKPAFALSMIAVISTYVGIRVYEQSEQTQQAVRMKGSQIAAEAPVSSDFSSQNIPPPSTAGKIREREADQAEPTLKGLGDRAIPAKNDKAVALTKLIHPIVKDQNAPAISSSGPTAPMSIVPPSVGSPSSSSGALGGASADEYQKDNEREGGTALGKPRSVSGPLRQDSVSVARDESASLSGPPDSSQEFKKAEKQVAQANRIQTGQPLPVRANAEGQHISEEQVGQISGKGNRNLVAAASPSIYSQRAKTALPRKEIQGKTFELRGQVWTDLSIPPEELNSFQTVWINPVESAEQPPALLPFMELFLDHNQLLIKLERKTFLFKPR
jgi:hypothetical protein